MNIRIKLMLAAVLALGSASHVQVSACGLIPSQTLERLARQAVSTDKSLSTEAVSKLRAAGPAGLEMMFKVHASAIGRHLTNSLASSTEEPATQWPHVKTALDGISGQCDAYAAKLYWYTDFELAKQAAKASAKPILSLRLLGKLNEEYSCANSRFFRTTLYPNAEVSQYLREHFILHWQSVRPVPKLTIDFGDGRKLERTITGNSIHYVLDVDGEPVDALPGLYGPQAFLKALTTAEQAARAYAELEPAKKKDYLRQYHLQCRSAISRELNADLVRLSQPTNALQNVALAARSTSLPTARMAGRLAFSKSAIESPVLRSIQSSDGSTQSNNGLPDPLWARIAALHADQSRLDDRAKAMVRSKNPEVLDASRLATTKRLVENPFLATLRNLERSVSEDSVRNEYLLHAEIHNWFVQGTAPSDLSGLNAKVYADLFLMPESDPWLGLVMANMFTGLQNDGVVEPTK